MDSDRSAFARPAEQRYVVDEAVAAGGPPKTPSEQKKLIAKIGHAIQDAGAAAVTEHFDQLYVLTRTRRSSTRARGFAVLLCETALGAAASGEALRPGASLPQAELQAGRDAFLMAAVLAQEAIATCDAAAEDEKKKPKGKKKQKADDDDGPRSRASRASRARAADAAALGPARRRRGGAALFIRAGARALLRKKLCAPAHREAAFDVVGAAYYGAPAEFAASAAAAVVEDLVLASEAGAQAAAECCAHLCGARGDAAGDVLGAERRRGLRRREPVVQAGRDLRRAPGARSPAAALAHVATLKAHLSPANHSLRSAAAAPRVLEADAAKRADAAANDASTDAARERLGDATRDALFELAESATRATGRACDAAGAQGPRRRARRAPGLVRARDGRRRVAAQGQDRAGRARRRGGPRRGGPRQGRGRARRRAADADEEDEDEDEPAVDEEAVAREAAARAAQLKELEYFGSAVAFVDRLERAGEKALKLLRAASSRCSPRSGSDAAKAEAAVAASLLAGTKAPPAECAARACALVAGCGAGDLACLEALVADSEKARAAGGAKADKAERIASPKLACRFLAVAAAALARRRRRRRSRDATRHVVGDDGVVDCALAAALGLLVRDLSAGAGGDETARSAARRARRSARRFADGKRLDRGRWYAAADAVVAATFGLEEDPEQEASAFVKALAAKCGFGDDDDADHVVNAAPGDLARLLHVVGHDGADREDLQAALGAGADRGDAEHEARMQHLVEAELVPAAASNLVSCFGPVARVAAAGLPTASGVGGPTRLPPVLHRAAVLCLSKMACVSRAFCDDHLPLLVTTLASDSLARQRRRARRPRRQPNSVEPWTEHVYGALRDGDATAPGAAVATPEERPSGRALSADDFATIMGFLLKFVDKEKHVETLAEKLCQRIESTKADDDGVLSDKVARKLHEKLVDYKDALADAPVYETFCAIAARASCRCRATRRPTTSTTGRRSLAAHEGRLDLDDLKPAAEPAAPPTAKKAPKKPAPKKRAKKKKKKADDDDDDDESDDDEAFSDKENAAAAPPPAEKARPPRAARVTPRLRSPAPPSRALGFAQEDPAYTPTLGPRARDAAGRGGRGLDVVAQPREARDVLALHGRRERAESRRQQRPSQPSFRAWPKSIMTTSTPLRPGPAAMAAMSARFARLPSPAANAANARDRSPGTSKTMFISWTSPWPVWIPNLQPDFNVRVIERFDTTTSAVLRELDESNRSVQKSAESTSI
ncbi:hypothetical protein JL720_816 [Aureococcus anophagefferens]|nr:hypothetical protein JL720_816 [Aureococcus anophagefferens]